MIGPLRAVGLRSLSLVQALGQMGVFGTQLLGCGVTPPYRLRRYLDELYNIGVLSIPIVCTSGAAVGLVLGLQGYHTLSRFGAEEVLGTLVGLTLIRELGPVLTGLLVTGRAGSAIAAELGSMVVTDQLDGLRMLSVDPVHFVAMPKALDRV